MKCVGQACGLAPPVSFSFAFSRIGLLHNRREMLLHRWTAATATTSYARSVRRSVGPSVHLLLIHMLQGKGFRREMLILRWTAATVQHHMHGLLFAQGLLVARSIFNASVQYASNTSSEDSCGYGTRTIPMQCLNMISLSR